jgi:hypothetical protein
MKTGAIAAARAEATGVAAVADASGDFEAPDDAAAAYAAAAAAALLLPAAAAADLDAAAAACAVEVLAATVGLYTLTSVDP